MVPQHETSKQSATKANQAKNDEKEQALRSMNLQVALTLVQCLIQSQELKTFPLQLSSSLAAGTNDLFLLHEVSNPSKTEAEGFGADRTAQLPPRNHEPS